MTYDVTVDHFYEDAKHDRAELTLRINRIWDRALTSDLQDAGPTELTGLLMLAGLDPDPAEDLAWLIVRDQAAHDNRLAIETLAANAGFDAHHYAFSVDRCGMHEAGQVGEWAHVAILEAYKNGVPVNGRGRLDEALADIPPCQLEASIPLFSDEPTISLNDVAQQAASGLRRGFTK